MDSILCKWKRSKRYLIKKQIETVCIYTFKYTVDYSKYDASWVNNGKKTRVGPVTKFEIWMDFMVSDTRMQTFLNTLVFAVMPQQCQFTIVLVFPVSGATFQTLNPNNKNSISSRNQLFFLQGHVTLSFMFILFFPQYGGGVVLVFGEKKLTWKQVKGKQRHVSAKFSEMGWFKHNLKRGSH